jgi:hypothetical protein
MKYIGIFFSNSILTFANFPIAVTIDSSIGDYDHHKHPNITTSHYIFLKHVNSKNYENSEEI